MVNECVLTRMVFMCGAKDATMLTIRRAEGREFYPRPGQYSRMSFSSEQVTDTVFPHLNIPFLPNSKCIENIVLVGKHYL